MEKLRAAELLHSRVSRWTMDEHRIGLKPIRRPVWAPTGQPLTCPVHPRYEWLYIYAFVCPETGESRFWLMPTLNKEAYQLVMAAFARSVGASAEHHILVVEDGGGFHVPEEWLAQASPFTTMLSRDTLWESKPSNCPLTRRSCNLPSACGT